MAPSSADLLDFALVLLAVAEAWVIPFLFIDGVSGLAVIRMAPWMSRSVRQGGPELSFFFWNFQESLEMSKNY